MAKVLVSMPSKMLESVDRMVEEGMYASRSEAIRDALRLLFQSRTEEGDEGEGEFSELLGGGDADLAYS